MKPTETSMAGPEGFLDDQFTTFQQLRDESYTEFVVEVVSLFFQDFQSPEASQ
ncbi:hypothetical protein RHGRI_020808 [Rhododendron griersonianum]|uniref:Uncharacterized protein n=1 Tax=Rhododendron griersonianum TaxID=479676 RepID=A0AAV6JJ07_9ERIC|nr:hypothetical protein RHGRI_020808 [Rhododendron griersonianum]